MKIIDFLAQRAEADSRNFVPGPSWLKDRPRRRKLFRSMLGLDPLPRRTPLKARTLGVSYRRGYRIERVVFQSLPGLYVRGNLYLPSGPGPFPAVLYLCGHARDGKVHYQSWGPGFALRGMAAFLIDTIEQNDGQGRHRGLHFGMSHPEWMSRGYTPAGVEVWNAIRALDYLESRSGIDPERLGATGLSGGGTMTWFLMAADNRVKVGSPACSTAHIPQHLRDGTLDTHCDCTFYSNFYGMSMEECYALAAPRPLLIAAQARDLHFRPWSYRHVFRKIAPAWKALRAGGNLKLVEDDGPHSYGPKLTAATYAWFSRHLGGGGKAKPGGVPSLGSKEGHYHRGEGGLESAATLSCFRGKLPRDDISATIQDSFWKLSRKLVKGKALISTLKSRCFSGWPDQPPPFQQRLVVSFDDYSGESVERHEFSSEPGVAIQVEIRKPRDWNRNKRLPLVVLPGEMRYGGHNRGDLYPLRGRAGLAYVEIRGLGPWSYPERAAEFVQRGGALVGYPLEAQRLWDLLRGLDFLRNRIPGLRNRKLWLYGRGGEGGLALLAALFNPWVSGVLARDLPRSFGQAPLIPGILRYLDIPQALAALKPRPLVRVTSPAQALSRIHLR